MEWTSEEQRILEQGLAEHPLKEEGEEPAMAVVSRYVKIAAMLANKTVVEVAYRVEWMKMNKETELIKAKPKSRKQKRDKNNGKNENHGPSTSGEESFLDDLTRQLLKGEDGNEEYDEIDERVGEFLKRNAEIMSEIQSNLESSKPNDNSKLFQESRQFLEEIIRLMEQVMPPGQLPKLPPLLYYS